ncbi:hypothetical protein SESBI_41510 [Sesbania bispinosa]|nr:hypothetical protein SESBI_41510 [Sesbania bispinosa]
MSSKDICLGEDKEMSETDSSDSDDFEAEDSMTMEDASDSTEEDGSSEDDESDENISTCLVVKVSKEERKHACHPWKHFVIVKLLGKRVGLKFFILRLMKIWNPMGKMEVIDLENDYFLIKF